jgi:hypothetical protein
MMHPVHEMFNDKLMATSWFQKVCVSSQIMEKLVIPYCRYFGKFQMRNKVV